MACESKLMVWWNGEGAARVFIHEDNAILMERSVDRTSLAEKARQGYDDEASQIIKDPVVALTIILLSG